MKQKELHVAALKNGTVIDHIPTEQVFKVVSLLGIQHLKTQVTIGYGLDSKKMGKKGILKIANKFFERFRGHISANGLNGVKYIHAAFDNRRDKL